MSTEIPHMRLTIGKIVLWWIALIAILSLAIPRFF